MNKILPALISLFLSAALATAEVRKPNFVVIFIDDLGYGDIGPFGSKKNKTPHLDQMAEEGMKLTSFYSAAPVCTPSRAALMTGCYPKRVGLATGSWHKKVLFPKDPHGLNPKEVTIAEVLRDAGYATGCFGKWHLGDQPEFLPIHHGFDTWFGIPYSHDMWPPHPPSKTWQNGVCPLPVLRGEKVVGIVEDIDDQAQLCKRFTDEAVSFIKQNKDRPFFVYLPQAFVHYPHHAREEFLTRAKGDPVRAHVEEIDWSVGQILTTIKGLGLEKNTMVLFTSDNGPAGGLSAGPLRGRKGSTFEGGMREPTLAWWPGTIPAKSVCDEIATTMDLLPTFAGLAGGKAPDDRAIDGEDIAPLLCGRTGAKTPHEAFFYYKESRLRAVRSGKWKLHVDGQLYNLDEDVGEKHNAAGEHPDVMERLENLLAECRVDLDDLKHCRPVGKNSNPKYLVPEDGPKDAAVTDPRHQSSAPQTTREIEIKGKYLRVPIKNGARSPFAGADQSTMQILDVIVDGTLVHSPNLQLAHRRDEVDWWANLDLSEYVGKMARLRMRMPGKKAKQAVRAGSKALEMIDTGDSSRDLEPLYQECLRPQLHFSQMRGWNNDTNGMGYYGTVYAGQCFSNAPDGRTIYMGWARDLSLPEMPFSQGFTLPVEFTLHETPVGLRLRANPVKEFDRLREKVLFEVKDKKLTSGESISFETDRQVADILSTVRPAPGASKLVLTVGDQKLGYDFETGTTLPIKGRHGKSERAPVTLQDGKLTMRVVVDRPMIESFYGGGQVYALQKRKGGAIGKITLETEGVVEAFEVHGMKSIWRHE